MGTMSFFDRKFLTVNSVFFIYKGRLHKFIVDQLIKGNEGVFRCMTFRLQLG